MIANQEQKKLELEEEIRTVATDLRTGKGDSEELQKRIAKLDYELQKVLENLSDKREKLAEADCKLSELKTLEAESKDKVESYREEVRLATYNLENQVRYRLAEAMVGDIIREATCPGEGRRTRTTGHGQGVACRGHIG